MIFTYDIINSTNERKGISMNIVECSNLSKNFGKNNILDNISFEIKEGEIFGFLGPNGAGKTTTIKILTGLLNAGSGDIKIMGKSITSQRYEALENIGAIVENPEFYTYLSGYENLMQVARTIDGVGKNEIDEAVDLVRLNKRINDKVKKYSLGMKQRLGVAQAILHRPKLLVLDEPTNGLDPAGIKEFREMIKHLSKEFDMSVLVSSHILSEVEQLCNRVMIIDRGKMVLVKDLSVESEEYFIIKSKDTDSMDSFLQKSKLKYSIDMENIKISIQEDDVFSLVSKLVENKISFSQIYRGRESLESKFLSITGGDIR